MVNSARFDPVCESANVGAFVKTVIACRFDRTHEKRKRLRFYVESKIADGGNSENANSLISLGLPHLSDGGIHYGGSFLHGEQKRSCLFQQKNSQPFLKASDRFGVFLSKTSINTGFFQVFFSNGSEKSETVAIFKE
ncbi:hypothetical protein [Pseudomonas fluorescens]|uniref:hypothetical protein n=1 Tax=Pseudomonas fluorescens TaxID=294 RepID=UPI000A6807B0|nr:hypothetical protein [Pseudomonas fluorescens]